MLFGVPILPPAPARGREYVKNFKTRITRSAALLQSWPDRAWTGSRPAPTYGKCRLENGILIPGRIQQMANRNEAMKSGYPPGPRTLLGLDILRRMQHNIFGFSRELVQKYGDEVSFRIGPLRFFKLANPDAVHEVLVREAKKFHKPTRLKQVLGRWDGQGLLLSEGDFWARQRRLVQQAFHPPRMQVYAQDTMGRAKAMLNH